MPGMPGGIKNTLTELKQAVTEAWDPDGVIPSSGTLARQQDLGSGGVSFNDNDIGVANGEVYTFGAPRLMTLYDVSGNVELYYYVNEGTDNYERFRGKHGISDRIKNTGSTNTRARVMWLE